MFDIVHLMHGRCLDLGCGPAPAFGAAPHVIGIDNDKDLRLFGAKAAPRIKASADLLPYLATGEYDVVFSSHMLEHVEDYRASLADWWRVLRPGGRLILYIPHAHHYPNIGMPGANPDHRHDFLPEDVTRAMREVAARSGQGWEQELDETRTGGFEYSFLQIYRKRPDGGMVEYAPRPKPPKRLGLVRLGAYGDALWITPILARYKEQGYHITLYTQKEGEASLRHDPNIDEMRVQPDEIFGEGTAASRLQSLYWQHCERQYDLFVNLVGSVERSLLPHPSDPNYWLPDATRRQVFAKNYVENVHFWAGVPFDPKSVRVKFTPSPEEVAFAKAERAKLDGPVVVISPSGSSLPKWWPHTQRALEILDAAGVYGVVMGDLRLARFKAPPPRARIIGTKWTIRQCYAFAALADVVIGTESAIINSVAHEPPLKIALLSHSTAHQLTRDWSPCIAVEPEGLACYPCHRIHASWEHCTRDAATGAAACQAAASPETVCGWALQWIEGKLVETKGVEMKEVA